MNNINFHFTGEQGKVNAMLSAAGVPQPAMDMVMKHMQEKGDSFIYSVGMQANPIGNGFSFSCTVVAAPKLIPVQPMGEEIAKVGETMVPR